MYVILVEIWGVTKWCHKNHKLPRGQCYHTFSNYWDTYLLKNQHEPYSAKMVPMAKILVPGSWTNMFDNKLYISEFHYSLGGMVYS